jgi:hypothetical protein
MRAHHGKATAVERAARFDDLRAAYGVVPKLRAAADGMAVEIHVHPRARGGLVTVSAELVDRRPDIHDIILREGGLPGWPRHSPSLTAVPAQDSLAAWWQIALEPRRQVSTAPVEEEESRQAESA